MNFLNRNKLILLILAITLLKGVIWSYATPLFQAPDEQAHYASVQYYAEPAGYEPKSYDFPLEKTDMFKLQTQNLSPELKNFLEKTQFEEVRFHKEKTMDFPAGSMDGSYERDIRQNTLGRFVTQYPAWVIHYSAPYYQIVAGIENLYSSRSLIERVYLERFFSTILLAIFVLFTYLTFRELGQNKNISALLAGAVSFQPMLTFITGSVNIDTLLIAAFGVLIYGAVRLLNRGMETVSALAILAGSLVSFFTKPPGYFSLVAILFLSAVFFFSRKEKYLARNKQKKYIIYSGFILLIVSLSTAIFILYDRIKERYFPGSQTLGMLWEYLKYQLTFRSLFGHSVFYWGDFGWLDTPIHRYYIYAIWLILAAGFAGILIYFSRNNGSSLKLEPTLEKKGEKRIFFYQVIFLLLTFLGFGFMIHAVNFQQVNPNNVADESNAIAIQGRYFFPVMGAKIFLIFWGITILIDTISQFVIPAKAGIQKNNSISGFPIGSGMTTRTKLHTKHKNIDKTASLFLFGSMVALNFISLFGYLIPRFYLGDGTAFFSQELLGRMSQYKPVMLKEWVIVFVLIIYLVFIVKFSVATVRKKLR